MSFPSVSSPRLNGIAHDGIRLPNHLVVKTVRTERVYKPQESIASIDSGTEINITGPYAGPVQIILNKGVNEQVAFSTMPFNFTQAGAGPVIPITVANMIPDRWCPNDDQSFFFESYVGGGLTPTMVMLQIAGRSGGSDAGTVVISLATGAGFPVAGNAVVMESCTGSFPVFSGPSV